MDSLELDVISKLNNVFSFNFKAKSFVEFSSEDILDVYRFLLRVYDPSWVLKGDKPVGTVLKQIHKYFFQNPIQV